MLVFSDMECYTISDVWLDFLHEYNAGKKEVVIIVSNVTIRSDHILRLLRQRLDNFLPPYVVEWDDYPNSVKFQSR